MAMMGGDKTAGRLTIFRLWDHSALWHWLLV